MLKRNILGRLAKTSSNILSRALSAEPEQFITKDVRRTGILELKGGWDGKKHVHERDVQQIKKEGGGDVVKNLRITKCDFSSEAAQALTNFLAKNNAIKRIEFTESSFGVGISELIGVFKENKSLESLLLINNCFNSDHAEQKTKALLDLLENPSLVGVKIGIDLDKKGIDATSKALETNKSLRFLSLKTNLHLGNAQGIIEMIQKNTCLRELSYGERNLFGNERLVDAMEISSLQERTQEVLKQNALLERVETMYTRNGFNIYNDNAAQIKDAVKDYSAILGARIIRKINEMNPNHEYGRFAFGDLAAYASKKTEDILLKNLTNAEMIAFSQHWHSPFHQTTSQKLRDYGNQGWPSLFGQKELNIPESVIGEKGWKFVVRTNAEELKREGKNLNHCVGGYSATCLAGDSHIVSVVDATGNPVSTIEFDDSVRCRQHYGKNNRPPLKQAEKAADWIQEEVKKGNIKIDHARIKSDKVKNRLLEMFGFDPIDDEKFKEVISVYKKQMLPSGKYEIAQLSQNFLNDFLGEIEVEDLGGRKFILESTLAKDRTEEEARLHKIKAGIQGSTNKILGKNIATTSVIDGAVFFSTKNPEALEKLKKLFDEKCEKKEDGILINGGLDPQEVRQILTRTAKAQRDQKRQEQQKPRPVVQNPISEINQHVGAGRDL